MTLSRWRRSMPGNHIELMEVPDDAFAVAPEHVVPTLGNVNHLLLGNPAVEVLGPFTAGELSSSSAARWYRSQQPTYICCWTVPHTPPVVGTSGGPGGGGGAIIADAKEVECGVLLNWIQAALTARSSTATPPTLQAHHWEVTSQHWTHLAWLHRIRWHHWWTCCGSRTPRRGRIKWRRAPMPRP